MGEHFGDFYGAIYSSISQLKSHGGNVDAGRWQGVPTEGKPDLMTKEILNLDFEVPLDRESWHEWGETAWAEKLAAETGCNLPWADEHFTERIGSIPLNPDPSHLDWPWWKGQGGKAYTFDGKFTHTYSERFWPKAANLDALDHEPPRRGIRYPLGDYNDVLDLLAEDPYTRQAYLPIFFPEDTGATHRGRIPCSLGYHFLLRDGHLHLWYEIRSCDAVRHFRDDLYLAARLVGHTIERLFERELRQLDGPGLDRPVVWCNVDPGTLYFKAHSFHVHMGDYHLL